MINMIAAGEVIERPASVVKELIENSIDAGATKITVSVEDGGRRVIRVSDNGCGMDAEDLGGAFEAHTTSKIKTSVDLAHISTLGFRGEALASITSVAQVKATSRTRKSGSANCIEIDCGDKSSVIPCSGDYGTSIQVRDLFYKLPVRRKFLKTANTEMGHISECFTRIGLARPEVEMTLMHNGREVYCVKAGQGRINRIEQLFSSEIAKCLIENQCQEKDVRIEALLGRPAVSKTSGRFQYTFLNGRFIRDKFILHAIKEAYRGLLEPNRFPIVFIFIEMPYEDYDVNVHPTKIEVRFYNSNLVHSQILGALREKLLGINLDVEGKLASPRSYGGGTGRSERITEAMSEFFKKHRPVTSQSQLGFEGTKAFAGQAPKTTGGEADFLSTTVKTVQIHNSYIVTQSDDGFMIIDQHALHERILYENLQKRIKMSRLESQRLLMPESLQVSQVQADAIENNCKLIEKLGIELVPFGPKTVAIQAFPVLLGKAEPAEFIEDLLDLLISNQGGTDAEKLLNDVLSMAACKAAIKAGQSLTESEIEQLLADKETVEKASRCPHGRPTTLRFTISELEKQFKRT
jgi:DNA mismatch repair protein MutL